MARAVSLADELYDKLKAEIISGTIAPGTRLPSQKSIATTQEVSRTVVREAVARLEAQGFARSRQGSGVFVTEGARYRAFQVTREELSELGEIVRLLEMRLAIETEMAGLAAARRDQADVDAMRAAMRQMAEVCEDPAAYASADAQFHMAIAQATKNPYFARFIDFLGIRLVPPRNLYLRDQPGEAHDHYVAKVRAEHEAILAAIVRMDITGARDAARHHMTESLSRHSELGAAMTTG
ncbi:FadR/GntR family transcriptional regulator [Croceibacterium sp. TMG7-5b_MA50]|uniref:FadR/GntR family transcriptional regulator n=1 Tax=Croceibacterium sp. TMG7-5b_MA50 TaxID=3121290 RepID=UPI0032215F9F